MLGIDIGGTKIDAQLFEVKDGAIAQETSWKIKEDTKKGVTDHTNQIANVIEQAAEEAKNKGGKLVAAGIVSPGRFDASGKIKPGTNANLEKETNEFNDVDLKAA